MLTIVFSSLLFLADVNADANADAKQMAQMCRSVNEIRVTHEESVNLSKCYGWILGATEVFNNEVFVSDNNQQCIPEGVTSKHLARIFIKHIETHPKLLHLPRAYVLKLALIDAFQCVSQDQ